MTCRNICGDRESISIISTPKKEGSWLVPVYCVGKSACMGGFSRMGINGAMVKLFNAYTINFSIPSGLSLPGLVSVPLVGGSAGACTISISNKTCK